MVKSSTFEGLVYGDVFNATLNIISVILWRSVLLVEETRVPEENHRPVVPSTPRYERDSK